MNEQETNPEIKKAIQELFSVMCQKNSVNDYPCKDVPCEYWWVRYAIACTYLDNAQQKIWEPQIEALQAKYNFDGYSYSGHFGSKAEHKLTDWTKVKIWVWSTKQKREIEVTNQISELWNVLAQAIENHIGWFDCPYEMDYQSKCPFYKPSHWYLQRKELEKAINSEVEKREK